MSKALPQLHWQACIYLKLSDSLASGERMLFCMQVVGLTAALGTIQGTDTGTFAIGLVLSLVVSAYTLMLGTLFAQLCLTKCVHETLDKWQCNLYANVLTSNWMTALHYSCFSCHRLKFDFVCVRAMWLSCR